MNLNSKVEKLRSGNSEYFEDIYLETNRLVFYIVSRYLKDEDAVQDIVQEVYISAWDNIDTLKDNNIQPWLNTIARNKSLDFLKKKKPMLFNDFNMGQDNDMEYDVEDYDTSRRPQELSETLESERLVQNIIDNLPEDQRACIMLFYYDQFTSKEIAELLNISENSVKSRLRYGKIKIKGNVEELESKGVKLYGFAPLPFFIYLLKDSKTNFEVPPHFNTPILPTVPKTIEDISKTSIIGKLENISRFSSEAITKVVLATVITTTAVGGTTVVVKNIIEERETTHNQYYELELGDEFDFNLINDLYGQSLEYTLDQTYDTETRPKGYDNDKFVKAEKYDFSINNDEYSTYLVTIDTKAPNIYIDDVIIVQEGDEIFLEDDGIYLKSFSSSKNETLDFRERKKYDSDGKHVKLSYDGNIDLNIVGKQKLMVNAEDERFNKSKKEIEIIVRKRNELDTLTSFESSEGNIFINGIEWYSERSTPGNYIDFDNYNLGNRVADNAESLVHQTRTSAELVAFSIVEYTEMDYWNENYIELLYPYISGKPPTNSQILNYPFMKEISQDELSEGDIIFFPDFLNKGNEILAVNLNKNYFIFPDLYPNSDYGRVSFYRWPDNEKGKNMFEKAKFYRFIKEVM